MAGMNLSFGRRPTSRTILDPRTGEISTRQAQASSEPYNALQPGGGLDINHVWGSSADGSEAAQVYQAPPSMTGDPSMGGGIGFDPYTAGGGTGSRASSASASAGSAERQRALSALEQEVRAGMGNVSPFEPSQTPITTSSPTDRGAHERATYGAAKERTGLALQSALRGLRESLSSRGIGAGSGIEGAATADLYAQGLNALAGTDRQLASEGSQRDYETAEQNTDRTIGQQQFNANQRTRANESYQDNQSRALNMLLQIAQSY